MYVGLIEEFEFFSRNELNPKKEIEANIVSSLVIYGIQLTTTCMYTVKLGIADTKSS